MDRIAGKMEQYMTLLSTRQKLVASNIANVDTPGYKTKDVDFQFEFLSRVDGAAPRVVEPELPSKNDGNNVSIDREARLLSENALRFNVASQLWRNKLRMLRNAVQDGRNG